MVESVAEESLPIVLIVGTEHTTSSRGKLVDALKLKQGEAFDLEANTWLISTNYYNANVKIEQYEVPADVDAIDSGIFEREIQSVIYYVENVEVSEDL